MITGLIISICILTLWNSIISNKNGTYQVLNMANKSNRNGPCHCGSGVKFKNCCHGKVKTNLSSKFGIVGIVVALAIGLVLLGFLLTGGDNRQDCPPGTEWSSLHQHCH